MHSTGTNQICGFSKAKCGELHEHSLNGRIPLLIMTGKYQLCKVRLETQQKPSIPLLLEKGGRVGDRGWLRGGYGIKGKGDAVTEPLHTVGKRIEMDG